MVQAAYRRIRRLLEATDTLWLACAAILLAWVFHRQTYVASRLIDGVRYFWLDDDMMISMTYARNLAEGHGLVWSAGYERVEGYSNFLWTMVMAAVHLFRPPTHLAAIPIRVISYTLTVGMFALAIRLLRVFVPRGIVPPVVMLTCMVLCPDIVLWSAWGFENALLGFLLLLFLVKLFERGDTLLAYLALSLVPITRADGIYLFLANAVVALVLSKDHRRTILWLAIALAPFAAHMAFRRSYYGEWLPNTYFLKVYGLTDKHARGFEYAKNFTQVYGVVIAVSVAAGVAIARRDRRGIAIAILVGANLAYVVMVGSDMFLGFRFFSHLVPVMFAFAGAGVDQLGRGLVGRVGIAAVLFVVSVPPLPRPFARLLVLDTNGDQQKQIQVAAMINKNARPESSMAVLCAGLVPYMTRRPALDMLGKSDKHIARLMPFPGSMSGHGKVDADYMVARRPDLIVTCNAGVTFTSNLSVNMTTNDPQVRFLSTPSFRETYLPNYIDDDNGLLFNANGIYTHPRSLEHGRRHWTNKITVAP
ncbi:MAG: hypothetical protein JST00_21280 [Deltaproteobacteria bacterium]|nr:hypothetical protein [Deltaproteobacteria bacterium]